MKIKMYNSGDENAIVDLFEKVFQRPWSLEQWEWRFAQNPFGNYKIALMWDGDTLAGHYAVSPVHLVCEGEIVKSAMSLTTMTHPEYGGKGVFKRLSSYLYDYLENKEDFQFIWGFPNTNSHYGFVKHLNWKDISTIPSLSATTDSFISSPEIEISEVTKFTTAMVSLLSSRAQNESVSVLRSKKYLQWRIVKKPATKYHIWIAGTNNDPSAVIISKLYPINEGQFDLNIIDWACKDNRLLSPLFADLIKKLNLGTEKIRRVTLWNNLFDIETYSHLEKLGFKPKEPVTYFAGRASKSMSSKLLNIKNWHLSFMDSDVY